MAPTTSAGARLRRQFQYPADTGSDSDPSAMDEEEQSTLITSLTQTHHTQNKTHTTILLLFPLLSTLPYILTHLSPTSPSPSLLATALALTSLGATTYLLTSLPPTETGLRPLDRWWRRKILTNSCSDPGHQDHLRAQATQQTQGLYTNWEDRTPLQTYLPYLNLGLCPLVALAVLKRGGGVDLGAGEAVQALLPAGVYGMVLAAKMVMGSVDPEVELGGLKYGYKGA